jgi:peptidoglycan/xylan/chitin deacetylase (PgdA/CDA1 family)
MAWGLTFDDGPSPETPKLLNYMNTKGVKATFYVIGSNVMARPAMLQAEYMSGHEISIHGWSHTPLTTLTTPQIVAELGWTRKVIKDVLGVTPNTFRPPQGDMDDRVRAISKAMGLLPMLWTEDATGSFDTFDWHITGGLATGQQQWDAFQKILATAETRTNGFITLQHDLHPETVNFALHVIPNVLSSGKYKITPVIDCLKKPHSEAYLETASNTPSYINVDGVPRNDTGSATTKPPAGTKTGTGSNPSATTNQGQATGGAAATSFAPIWMAASLGLVFAAMMGL